MDNIFVVLTEDSDRPGQPDNGEYYWSNPACGASGANFAWVYDKLSSKYYVIRPYATDNIEAGIIADPYAFDQVIEPENNPVIKGTGLYVFSDTYVPALGGHDAYIGYCRWE